MKHTISSKWDELSNNRPTFACEELLLRNTFVNSQNVGPIAAFSNEPANAEKPKKRAIQWIDESENNEGQKNKMVTNASEADLIY